MVAPDFRAWPPTKKITPTRTLSIARTRRRRNRTKNSRFRRLPACASCHPPAPLARRLPEREWFDWRGSAACRRGRDQLRRSQAQPAPAWQLSTRLVFSACVPSRPGELHPEPLTDPDLILSHHPARATVRRLPPSVACQVPPVAG